MRPNTHKYTEKRFTVSTKMNVCEGMFAHVCVCVGCILSSQFSRTLISLTGLSLARSASGKLVENLAQLAQLQI